MTKATRGFLYYLSRYIGTDPKRRKDLCELHLKHTKRELNTGNLSRHLDLRVEPKMSTALVYMIFLHRRGELIAGKKTEAIFRYANPELLKK